MKYLVWLISSVNVYFGLRCFLNAIHVLKTSKYSQGTTVLFAVLFLGLGAAGFYFTLQPSLLLAGDHGNEQYQHREHPRAEGDEQSDFGLLAGEFRPFSPGCARVRAHSNRTTTATYVAFQTTLRQVVRVVGDIQWASLPSAGGTGGRNNCCR